jgi:methyl-accepting chemotaxis protein
LKEDLLDLECRLDLQKSEESGLQEADAIVAYLEQKRKMAMENLKHAMHKARNLFNASGPIQQSEDACIEVRAVEQLSKKAHTLKLPCWYWGKTPLHYDQSFVDKTEKLTGCQATIFQRIPEGFIRISTNIRNINGRRAVGTYISNESKVVQTVLSGNTYHGSAFALNNWYLSIYEPFYFGDEVAGILYVGRRESLELMPTKDLPDEKIEHVFSQLQSMGAFQSELDDVGSGEPIKALSQLPEHTLHPVINLGLKELSAMLLKERERKTNTAPSHADTPELHFIVDYIQTHLTEDISIDFLTDHLYMSKASLYRYFKKRFNTTPRTFINQERLRQAHQLMQSNSALSINEICTQVGFNNVSYFIKLFKEQYGITPKQYQKQLKQSEEDRLSTN